MNKTIEIHSVQELEDVAHQLKKSMSDCAIFTFTGPLGAGKTTLIKMLLRLSSVKETVVSPTFTYVNVYHNDKGETFYHFDLYRIKAVEDFISAGFNEYLYQPKSWCLIEWPEVIMPLLREHVCHVKIEYSGESSRNIQISSSI